MPNSFAMTLGSASRCRCIFCLFVFVALRVDAKGFNAPAISRRLGHTHDYHPEDGGHVLFETKDHESFSDPNQVDLAYHLNQTLPLFCA